MRRRGRARKHVTRVAINTVTYGALALAKTLPKVYLSDWAGGRNRRAEFRSIYPEPLD